MNPTRVERIWRQEGLKVLRRQPKRGRLWLTDGSCIRLRPTHRRHVEAYDLLAARTHDGRPLHLFDPPSGDRPAPVSGEAMAAADDAPLTTSSRPARTDGPAR